MQPARMTRGGRILASRLVERKVARVGEEEVDMSVRSSAIKMPEEMLIPMKAGREQYR